MKELKNKDVIIGLIVLIILCVAAIILIIRREFPDEEKKDYTVQISAEEEAPEEIPVKAALGGMTQEEALAAKAEAEILAIQQEAAAKAKENKTKVEENKNNLLTDTDNVQDIAITTEKKADSLNAFHTEPQYKAYTGEEMWQLEELYFYWNEYKLEAVDDLIRLPRVRTMTNELSGTNSFYYYGETNSKGMPDGSGLAVYENNAYYCGEWKDGKRNGQGMWLQIFPDKPGIVNGVTGVTEHSYNGNWSNDYPNGEGQEHISYDYEEMDGEDIITNVIGNFADGYYDGNLYIMTTEGENQTVDWEASANKGVFVYCDNRVNVLGKRTVWERMEKSEDKEEFLWMFEEVNQGFGIFGLKKKN